MAREFVHRRIARFLLGCAAFFYARDGRPVAGLVGEHKREEFEKTIRALLELDAKTTDQPRTKASSPGP